MKIIVVVNIVNDFFYIQLSINLSINKQFNLKFKKIVTLLVMSIEEKYIILEQLDNGNMMKVKSKRDETEKIIKQISFKNMTDKQKKKLIEEVNTLMAIQSTNIVKYEDFIIDKNKVCLYVVSQYCSGGSLEDLLNLNRQQSKRLEEKVIWKIFEEVVSAVNQIHNDKKGTILHRDIRPASIFLDKSKIVKLGNFNLLRRLDPTEQFAQTSLTNTYYRSPQQICQGIFTTKSDIWALGCLLYEMAALKVPFETGSQFLTCKRIKQNNPEPIPNIYSKQLNRVIKWCLCKQSDKRPTIYELTNIPEVNCRTRNRRVAENRRLYQEREKRVIQKQLKVRQLQAQLRDLQKINKNQSIIDQDKQNNSFNINYLR